MKALLKYSFLWMPWVMFGQIETYEYWYNDDYASKTVEQVTNLNSINLNDILDVSALQEGLHTYSIHFKDVNNLWSSVSSDYFFKFPDAVSSANNQINYYQYWIDDSYNGVVGVNITPQTSFTLNQPFFLNLTYTDGLHSYNIRFRDENNLWSGISTSFFYRLPDNISTPNLKLNQYEYWFDDDYGSKAVVNAAPQETIVLNNTLDVSSFDDGLHHFSIRFRDENNQWSSVNTEFFYKLPENTSNPGLNINQYEYWFNDDYANKVFVNTSPNAILILDDMIDASMLVNGLHAFNIRFKDELDQWTSVSSSFIYKNAESLTVFRDVVEYQYWFNDDYDNNAIVTVSPDEIYALDTFVFPESFGLGLGFHDLNIRFKDSSGQWSSIVTEEFEITILLDTQIPDKVLSDVVVYPNPTFGVLYVNLNEHYDQVLVSVTDYTGRIIKQDTYKNVNEIEFNLNVSPGVYILIVEHKSKRSIHRILKR